MTASVALLLLAAPVRAQSDGVYGRLTGDMTVEAIAGGGLAFEPGALVGSAALELRARYIDSAGIMLAGELRPDGASRAIVAIDLRPLFLGRFLIGASFHDRYWDLLIDSIGLDLGVAITPFRTGVGVALAVGFGADVPLVFFSDGLPGLALRLSARHVAAQATDQWGPAGGSSDWLVFAGLVLRGQLELGLPGWEPPRYQTR